MAEKGSVGATILVSLLLMSLVSKCGGASDAAAPAPTTTVTVTATATSTITPTETQRSEPGSERVTVVTVIDGRTLRVRAESGSERDLRLGYLDVPVGKECLATEATEFLSREVPAGTEVTIEYGGASSGGSAPSIRHSGSLLSVAVAEAGLGWAVADPDRSGDYREVERATNRAANAAVGVFTDDPDCTLPAQLSSIEDAIVVAEDYPIDDPAWAVVAGINNVEHLGSRLDDVAAAVVAHRLFGNSHRLTSRIDGLKQRLADVSQSLKQEQAKRSAAKKRDVSPTRPTKKRSPGASSGTSSSATQKSSTSKAKKTSPKSASSSSKPKSKPKKKSKPKRSSGGDSDSGSKYTGPRCYAPGGKSWRPC